MCLPQSLAKLQHLTQLSLKGAQFDELPPVVMELQSLQWLTLTFMNLRRLPADFDRLQDLRTLELHYNPLERFPEPLYQIPNLRMLFIDLHVFHREVEIERLTELKSLSLQKGTEPDVEAMIARIQARLPDCDVS